MELQHALKQIADIRRQIDHVRPFRGFRAGSTGATALLAVAAGIWQAWELNDPANHPGWFVLLWVGVAIASMGVCALEVVHRYRISYSASQREMTRMAIEQFLPFVLVGGLLAFVLYEYAAAAVWMLPGLWQILFGLGLLSLRRLFPAAMRYVGAFYILCGLLNLSGFAAHFSAWSMSVPFALGQAASAGILYWYLEHRHAA